MQLFNSKTIKRHILRASEPDPAKLDAIRQWGDTIRDRSIETQKETALHGNFKQRIMCDVLGYRDFNESGQWTVDVEAQIGAGSVDLALGHQRAKLQRQAGRSHHLAHTGGKGQGQTHAAVFGRGADADPSAFGHGAKACGKTRRGAHHTVDQNRWMKLLTLCIT